MGITTLDTRTLQTYVTRDIAPTARSHLVNTHFSFSCGYGRAFLFGDTVRRDKSQLQQVLLDSLTIADHTNAGRKVRRIVLVGHNIRSELSNMKHIGLDLETLPMIVGLLDTAQLSREVLQCGWLSLGRLVNLLGIPLHHNVGGVADKLHNAGNDAHYTMRAMLALSSLHYSKQSSASSEHAAEALAWMMDVARETTPIFSTHARTRRALSHKYTRGIPDYADLGDLFGSSE